ncbi:unnamed protein product [Durusdinium trenchii]|uniref:non-specific serine/threonine protein kinase n=1 Tax=Durusdinium trenchii TaxID=1381693 RepID=A0ABP0HA90_9DINO
MLHWHTKCFKVVSAAANRAEGISAAPYPRPQVILAQSVFELYVPGTPAAGLALSWTVRRELLVRVQERERYLDHLEQLRLIQLCNLDLANAGSSAPREGRAVEVDEQNGFLDMSCQTMRGRFQKLLMANSLQGISKDSELTRRRGRWVSSKIIEIYVQKVQHFSVGLPTSLTAAQGDLAWPVLFEQTARDFELESLGGKERELTKPQTALFDLLLLETLAMAMEHVGGWGSGNNAAKEEQQDEEGDWVWFDESWRRRRASYSDDGPGAGKFLVTGNSFVAFPVANFGKQGVPDRSSVVPDGSSVAFPVRLLVRDLHDQELALKVVPCDHLDDREAANAAAATLAEARLLQQLRHPNIVACHDVQFDPSRRCVWLALEFLDGGDLGNGIKVRRLHNQSPFDGYFLERVLSMVGGALHYIHSQGVLHRDVKPPNLLVDRHMQEVKLADFGVSKILEASGYAGTVLGTPAYHPPELVSGKPYGPPADAWALGVCLYELASLQRPFDASNQLALVWQIVEHQPPALPPETPADMVEIIRGLLQKDPLQRLRLEDLGFTLPEVSCGFAEGGHGNTSDPTATKRCLTMSECSGVGAAAPEAGYDSLKVMSDEQVPTPPVAPLSLHVATEGSELEEVMLEDTPVSPTPRTRTEGLTAFVERSPATPTTPRRNWLSRLGRGLRYGVLGGHSGREEAVVSFNESEVVD